MTNAKRATYHWDEEDLGGEGLIEHLEILCEDISQLNVPLEMSILTQDDAKRSLNTLNQLQDEVKGYRRALTAIISGLEQQGLISNN